MSIMVHCGRRDSEYKQPRESLDSIEPDEYSQQYVVKYIAYDELTGLRVRFGSGKSYTISGTTGWALGAVHPLFVTFVHAVKS